MLLTFSELVLGSAKFEKVFFGYRGHANAANKRCQSVPNRLELILRCSLTARNPATPIPSTPFPPQWAFWPAPVPCTIADYSCVCRVLRPDPGPRPPTLSAFLHSTHSCPLQLPPSFITVLRCSLVACLRPKRRRCRCHWRFMSTAAAAQYSNSLHSLITCRQLCPPPPTPHLTHPCPALPWSCLGRRHQLLKRWTAKLCVRPWHTWRGLYD